jgi:hypothetical protein
MIGCAGFSEGRLPALILAALQRKSQTRPSESVACYRQVKRIVSLSEESE